MEHQDSTVVRRVRCPKCADEGRDTKGDNLAIYSDGHAYCYSCGTYFRDAERPETVEMPADDWKIEQPRCETAHGEIRALTKRGITLETCKLYNYQSGVTDRGTPVQIAVYYGADGETACHYRAKDKKFWWSARLAKPQLYGQHLWRGGGRRLIITEGEIDALTVSQIQGNKWPVVSLPSGAGSAAKATKDNLEFIETFREVVICTDMDEPGRKAAKDIASLLTPGKARIVHLPAPYKDANEMLQDGATAQLVTALWEAKPYRPDGILNGKDLWAEVLKEPPQGFAVSYPKFSAACRGVHKGKLLLITAGSGIGKSTIAHEIGYELLTKYSQTLGILALEEDPKRVADRYVGLRLEKRIELDHSGVTEEELHQAFNETLGSGKIWIYDHFGSQEADVLMSKIRYMTVSLKCDFIILDHISIAISGLDEIIQGDERKIIDVLITKLRSLIQETGVGIIAICHLKNPQQGKSYNNGREVSLNDLRGSGSLGHVPDIVLAIERDQQGDDPNRSRLRILKNRHVGITGVMDTLEYNPETGRLLAVPDRDENPFAEPTDTNPKGEF